jgi:hypothetical protein
MSGGYMSGGNMFEYQTDLCHFYEWFAGHACHSLPCRSVAATSLTLCAKWLRLRVWISRWRSSWRIPCCQFYKIGSQEPPADLARCHVRCCQTCCCIVLCSPVSAGHVKLQPTPCTIGVDIACYKPAMHQTGSTCCSFTVKAGDATSTMNT